MLDNGRESNVFRMHFNNSVKSVTTWWPIIDTCITTSFTHLSFENISTVTFCKSSPNPHICRCCPSTKITYRSVAFIRIKFNINASSLCLTSQCRHYQDNRKRSSEISNLKLWLSHQFVLLPCLCRQPSPPNSINIGVNMCMKIAECLTNGKFSAPL